MATLKFHQNNKGGVTLETPAGYLYYKYEDGVNKVIWRCRKYGKNCRGICHTTSSDTTGMYQLGWTSEGRIMPDNLLIRKY